MKILPPSAEYLSRDIKLRKTCSEGMKDVLGDGCYVHRGAGARELRNYLDHGPAGLYMYLHLCRQPHRQKW